MSRQRSLHLMAKYLPDFLVGDRHYIELKPEGKGTPAVLDKMRIILASDPDAILSVIEGTWVGLDQNPTGYIFNFTESWPPLVSYWVYVVPGCDSWHHLGELSDDMTTSPPVKEIIAIARAIADEVIPDLDCWEHQRPRAYVQPDAYDCLGSPIWAIAFHKGDAALVSTRKLPWLSEYLAGHRRRRQGVVW